MRNLLDDELVTAIYKKLQEINNIAGYEEIKINKYETTGNTERLTIFNKNVERPIEVQINDIWINIYVPHIVYNNETYRNYKRCFEIKNQINNILSSNLSIDGGIFFDIEFTGHLTDPFEDPEKPGELCYPLKYKLLAR